MEESYRIDSVFEHRLSVSFPRFSQFLSSFYPPIPSTTTLLLTRYQSCISSLSTGVSALKYLVNLDEARKSRTRRVSEKGTAKKGNCARCHSFFFRSFSPSFSFSFFPLFFRLPFFLSLLRFTRVAGLRFPYNTVHVQPPRLRSEFACKLRAISFREIWNHPTIYVCTRASGFDSVYRIGGER